MSTLTDKAGSTTKEGDLLSDVKMLLILQLLSQGVTQSHIAAVLGISDATMSRMLPKGLSSNLRRDRS